MSLVLSRGEICPKCHEPLMQAVVEAHPSRRDIAYHNFECADCGPIKTKVISLNRDEPPTGPSA
jgi:RNase P subunit RPR2